MYSICKYYRRMPLCQIDSHACLRTSRLHDYLFRVFLTSARYTMSFRAWLVALWRVLLHSAEVVKAAVLMQSASTNALNMQVLKKNAPVPNRTPCLFANFTIA